MAKKKRRSAAVKEEVVLRLLKGEDLELTGALSILHMISKRNSSSWG